MSFTATLTARASPLEIYPTSPFCSLQDSGSFDDLTNFSTSRPNQTTTTQTLEVSGVFPVGTSTVYCNGYDMYGINANRDGNEFPTFALLDHSMSVRAKPWTLENNSNTSSCDGTNSSVSGWSGGNTNNFLQQLVDECGDLCINGGCTTTPGDLNEDEILNIQDIITMVNLILGSTSLEGCALEAADMNVDGIINIQDLISLVNAILGSARIAQLDGHATVSYTHLTLPTILLV